MFSPSYINVKELELAKASYSFRYIHHKYNDQKWIAMSKS